MVDKQIIIDDCIHLDEWKHCDICEKLIKTKDGANGKKREHLLTEEDLRCDFYPNCYYKQLKRKEQECEKAKQNAQDTYELYQALIESFNILQGDKIKLERKCEELKDKLNCCFCNPHFELNDFEKQRKCIEVTECFRRQLDKLKAENERLQEEREKAKNYNLEYGQLLIKATNKNNKLEKTLAEIKKIAEKQQSWNEWNSKHSETESEDDIFAYNCSALKQILQKISEVE